MTAEREGLVEEIAGVLAEHRPSGWHWDCTCGGMEPATFRTHDAEHRAHLADALADRLAARDRRVRAEAWDEGYEKGRDDAIEISPEWAGGSANPYRAARIEGEA